MDLEFDAFSWQYPTSEQVKWEGEKRSIFGDEGW